MLSLPKHLYHAASKPCNDAGEMLRRLSMTAYFTQLLIYHS